MTNKEETHFLLDTDAHYDTKKDDDHDVKERDDLDRYDAYSARDAYSRNDVKEREADDTVTNYETKVDDVSFIRDSTDVRDDVKEREGDDTVTNYDTNVRDGIEARDDVKKREGNDTSPFYDTKVDDVSSIRDGIEARDGERENDNTVTNHDTNASNTFLAPNGSTDTRNTSQERDGHDTTLDDAKARNDAGLIGDKPDDCTKLSPGTRLRKAREQQNLSVKHIADRLYLDVHVIEALEKDNYEGLPPTIFVRGYLRNYAKLLESSSDSAKQLDISPESIIASFEHITEQQQQPSPAPKEKKQKKQASSRDFWPTIGTIVVIVTLMVLMALWQFYPNSPEPQPPMGNIVPNEDSRPSEILPSNPRVTEPSRNPSGNDEPKTNAPSGLEKTGTVTTSQSKPADLVLETPSDEPDMIDSSTPTTDFSTLRVHFKQEAWMKITDYNGNKVYEDTGDAGKILPLKGTPPFYLKVGNVDGVEIEDHGEISSIKTYPKQGRRTFIIGSDE